MLAETYMHRCILFLLVPLLSAASSFSAEKATNAPPRGKGITTWYVGNRPPLAPALFVKLPVGSVRPEGWLRQQLTLMADGFTGHLSEISPWCKFEGSAWTSPTGDGKAGWEELPYWLKGYVDLGYVLGDKRIIAESKKWIEAILASQQPDGYFGSKANHQSFDIWPNMVVLYAMRSYYEATRDPRVINFMLKYCKWLTTIPPEKYLPGSWQKIRGGDNLESIHWLYNQTGEEWLLDLAKFNHERTADWVHGIPTWHGVNITQSFREPAQYFVQSHNRSDLDATLRNYDTVMKKYGQVPGGMFGADENAREGYSGPRQGAETCSMVEYMYSHQMLVGITSDRTWADRCEDVAFNSLPASMTPDLKGLHYLTSPNLIQLDRGNKAPMVENDGDMFSYNPHQYRCCQHNVAFGWPYYAEHLWMATPGDGLAAVLYAPSVVVAKTGRGIEIRITERTDYPFGDSVSFEMAPAKNVRFPLRLRIPAWCHAPKLSLNNKPAAMMMPSEGWVIIDRIWKRGDKVVLELPMPITVRTWADNKNSISVDRGPLTYSLKIGENWQKYGNDPKWPGFEVFPTTPWNYALIVDSKNPGKSFQVEKKSGKLALQPFTPESAPIALKAKARRVPEWKQESNGFVGKIMQSPVSTTEPIEEITLIPMGAARLRISAFPQAAQ